MATVKRCDRCSAYYDKNKNQSSKHENVNLDLDAPIETPITHAPLTRLITHASIQPMEVEKRDDIIDLCDSCWRSFREWMDKPIRIRGVNK